MSQTLLTGASGLLSHQRKLDVVANNLANLNTVGFKSQRLLFSDLIYTTIQPASAGSNADFGGTNPRQAGFGVSVAQTSRNHGQGVLSSTGQAFDFAIQGNGFFVVSDGAPAYTRAGAFSLDSNGYLVDPSTGALVQRVGDVGEGKDGNPQFQAIGNPAIHVPLGAGIAGRLTSGGEFAGNLPATATPPRIEELGTEAPLLAGGSPALLTTLLNDLDSNTIDYVAGDSIDISGSNAAGTPFSTNFAVDGTTTIADLLAAINGNLPDATATLDVDGNIKITADAEGDSDLSLKLVDEATNTGASEFSDHPFLIETDGKDGDIVETTIQVFDLRGEPHDINVSFQKQENNIWDATFELLDETTGELLDSSVAEIEFSENGQFRTVNGVGDADSDIELQFEGLSEPQTINMTFDNLTHMATSYAITFDQDGFPPGNLASVTVDPNGTLSGVATNGQRIPIAQLAIASFINNQGLEAAGQNYFKETANSGTATISAGMSGSSGVVRGGQLESSNVDVALEFTQLIVAQRGFSANARTITVANEVLQELTNIIR